MTDFTGKTWISMAMAIVPGILGVISLSMGPLFLFDVIKDANGRPARDAGVALTLMSVPCLAIAALGAFNVVARRQPLLRICQEGLVVRLVSRSSLDHAVFVPQMIRVAWLLLSGQGFKQQYFAVMWEDFGGAEMTGLPMARALTLVGTFLRFTTGPAPEYVSAVDRIVFEETTFVTPVAEIAELINGYHQHPDARDVLASWDE